MDNVKNVIDSGAPFVDLHLAVAPAEQLLVGEMHWMEKDQEGGTWSLGEGFRNKSTSSEVLTIRGYGGFIYCSCKFWNSPSHFKFRLLGILALPLHLINHQLLNRCLPVVSTAHNKADGQN